MSGAEKANFEEAFYLVWRENGPGPRVKHATHRSAAAEAQRLARGNPGERFVVLQSTHAFEVNDMKVTRYESEIPF